MGQSRRHSFIEAVVNVAVGYGVATLASYWVLPLLGVPISLRGSMLFGVFMTVVSVARSYLLRRLFNRWHTS